MTPGLRRSPLAGLPRLDPAERPAPAPAAAPRPADPAAHAGYVLDYLRARGARGFTIASLHRGLSHRFTLAEVAAAVAVLQAGGQVQPSARAGGRASLWYGVRCDAAQVTTAPGKVPS